MFFRFGGVSVKRKLRKIVAIICVVCALSTIFAIPDVTVQIVQADAIGVGEFSRIFSSLSGALGATPKGSGSKFWGNMMDMYGHSFDIWCKTYNDMNDRVQSWNNLLLQDVKTFTEYMIKSFPNFLKNYKDGTISNSDSDSDSSSDVYKSFINYFNVDDKEVVFDSLEGGQQYGVHIGDLNKLPVLNPNENGGCPNNDTLNAINDRFSLDSQYYFWGSHENAWVNFYAIEPATHTFLYIGVDKSVKMYTDSANYFQARYWNYKTPVAVSSLELSENVIKTKPLGIARFRGLAFSTNMAIRIFSDGSALVFDPSLIMSKDIFNIIQDSLWDQISKSGTNIDDWALADENAKTIDEPESKILDKIYNNMLTADDIKALENGDTSVLEKLQGITAVNEKTGETVGNIKEDVNDAVGILGAIKLIGKRIFARQLTLINLVKNLAKGKWTSVIDNVGDLTLPIVNSIDSIKQVVSSLSSMKWVIDNVGDICNPIGTAIDTMNGNIANLLSSFGNAILNAIDNIKTLDLTDVIDNIKAVPTSIAQSLTNVVDNIKAIPNTVATCIADVFVPSADDFSNLKKRANTIIPTHFGISADDLNISISERKFSDIKYKKNVIVKAKTLNNGIDSIRPAIQGLCWFGLILFAINQILQIFDKKGVGDNDSD